MSKIDITGLDKAEVLLALYNASDYLGRGYLGAVEKFDLEDARREYEASNNKYFDYLHGKAIKADLSGDEFDDFKFDNYFGKGAAQRAIDGLRNR